VLRHLQIITLGVMKLGQHVQHVVMTDISKILTEQLVKLGLASLFSAPPNRQPRSPTKAICRLSARFNVPAFLAITTKCQVRCTCARNRVPDRVPGSSLIPTA
jgi:hypothetical protein